MTAGAPTRSGANRLYTVLTDLAALAVLLQAVWAGVFIREGKQDNQTWVDVHARGAEVAIALAALAAIVVLAKLRDRRPLVVGSIGFVVLLVLEAYLGGLVGGNPAVEIVHFPLAMALMGLAVWLPLAARRPVLRA